MAPGDQPQLHDARGPRDHDEQDAENGGQQQRDPERQVAVRPEEADVHPLAVLQYEDQQQEQHQREQRGRDPDSAGPGALHDMLGGQSAGGLARSGPGGALAYWR